MSIQAEDEALYAKALHEVSSGALRPGLWAQALVEANGDKNRASIIYMRHRVALLKEEKLRAEAAKAEEARMLESVAISELLIAFPNAKSLSEETLKRLGPRFVAGEDISGEIEAAIEAKRQVPGGGWIMLFIVIGSVVFIWYAGQH